MLWKLKKSTDPGDDTPKETNSGPPPSCVLDSCSGLSNKKNHGNYHHTRADITEFRIFESMRPKKQIQATPNQKSWNSPMLRAMRKQYIETAFR